MIYTKTELGQSALQNRAFALTPRQRSAFILFDGKRSLEDVLKMTVGLRVDGDDVTHLVELGLLAAPDLVAPAVLTPKNTPATPLAWASNASPCCAMASMTCGCSSTASCGFSDSFRRSRHEAFTAMAQGFRPARCAG